jgi:hypothetical protein
MHVLTVGMELGRGKKISDLVKETSWKANNCKTRELNGWINICCKVVGAVCPFSPFIPEELEAYALKACYELIKLPITPERILVSRGMRNPPF